MPTLERFGQDAVALTYYLRAHGMPISLEQCLDAQQLWNELAEDGSALRDQNDLIAFLAPVLTTSPEERTRFRQLLGEYRQPPPPPSPSRPPSPSPRPRRRRRDRAVSLAGISLLCCGAVFAWLPVAEREKPKPPVVSPPAGTPTNPKPKPIDPPRTQPPQKPEAPTPSTNAGRIVELTLVRTLPGRSRNLWGWWWATVLPPLFVLAVFMLRQRLRPSVSAGEPSVPHETLASEFPRLGPELQATFDVRRAARRLRQRERISRGPLDLVRTVHRTAMQGGLPAPVFSSQVDVQYLALVQRRHRRDHQASLAQRLLVDLAEHGVPVELYLFDETPEQAYLEQGGRRIPTSLAVLLSQYPEHRLLVVGDGTEFYDRRTGQLAGWVPSIIERRLALLTTVPVQQWTRREWQLEVRLGIPVVPLLPEGLHELQTVFSGRHTSRMERAAATQRGSAYRSAIDPFEPDEAALQTLLDDLRRDLTPAGFEWLCALAVYPGFHWSITCALGAALLQQDYRLLLPRLVQLPWLREGRLPEWLRARLIRELTPAREQQVRAELLKILASVEQRQPGQESAEMDPREILRVRGGIYNDEVRDPLNDDVFLEFLTQLRGSRDHWRLPAGLLRQLAPRGVWLAGLNRQAAITAGIVTALTWALLIGVWWSKPDTIGLALSPGGTQIIQHFGGDSSGLMRSTIGGSGKTVHVIANDENVQLLPDGKRLLFEKRNGPEDSLLQIHDLATGKLLLTLETVNASIHQIFPTPDGRSLVAPAGGGNIYVWDAATGKRRFNARPGGRLVAGSVTVTPDSQHLITTEMSSGLGYWKLDSGDYDSTPKEEIGVTTCVAATPDNRWIVTGGDDGKLRLWERSTGRLAKTLPTHHAAITSLVVAADQTVITGDMTGAIRLWSIEQETNRWLDGHHDSITALALTPDGKRLISGGADGMVRIWELPTGQLLQAFQEHPQSDLLSDWGIRVATDGTRLVTIAGNQAIRVRDLDASPTPETERFTNQGQLVAVSHNGREVVLKNPSGGFDLRSRTGELVQRFSDAMGIRLSADPNVLVTWRDRRVRLWERPSDSTQFFERDLLLATSAPVLNAFEIPMPTELSNYDRIDASFLMVYQDGRTQQFAKGRAGDVGLSLELDRIVRVDASPDLRRLCFTNADGVQQLVNPDQLAPAGTIPGGPFTPVQIVFSPNGSLLLEWDAEGRKRLIDCLSPDAPRSIPLANVDAPIAAAFSQFGSTCFIHDRTRKLHFVDQEGTRLRPPLSDVAAIAHRPGRDDLAVVFDDGSLQLWSLLSARPISDRLRATSHIRRITASPNLTTNLAIDVLVTEHADGSLSEWQLEARGTMTAVIGFDTWLFNPNATNALSKENAGKQADPKSSGSDILPTGIDLSTLFNADIKIVMTSDELLDGLSHLLPRHFLLVNAMGWQQGEKEWAAIASAMQASPVRRILVVTDQNISALADWSEPATVSATETSVKSRTVLKTPPLVEQLIDAGQPLVPNNSINFGSNPTPLNVITDTLTRINFPCDGAYVAQRISERLTSRFPGRKLAVTYHRWPAAGHSGGDVYFPEAVVSMPSFLDDETNPVRTETTARQMLHKLGLALGEYTRQNQSYPQDWRSELLPLLEQQPLFATPTEPHPIVRRIVAVNGPGTVWGSRPIIEDGTTTGIVMLALTGDVAVGQVSVDEALAAVLKSERSTGVWALFNNGQVQRVPPTMNPNTLRSLLVPYGKLSPAAR